MDFTTIHGDMALQLPLDVSRAPVVVTEEPRPASAYTPNGPRSRL
jgi:hypothetical protein